MAGATRGAEKASKAIPWSSGQRREGGGDGAELRFAKFERRRLHECFDFIRAKGLLGCNGTALTPGF